MYQQASSKQCSNTRSRSTSYDDDGGGETGSDIFESALAGTTARHSATAAPSCMHVCTLLRLVTPRDGLHSTTVSSTCGSTLPDCLSLAVLLNAMSPIGMNATRLAARYCRAATTATTSSVRNADAAKNAATTRCFSSAAAAAAAAVDSNAAGSSSDASVPKNNRSAQVGDYVTGPTTHFGYEDVSIETKEGRVREVFESVAGNYDIMNDLMSWQKCLVEKLLV